MSYDFTAARSCLLIKWYKFAAYKDTLLHKGNLNERERERNITSLLN